jgi:hypothetical protein
MSRSALGLAPLEFVTRDQAQSQLARAAVESGENGTEAPPNELMW